MLFHTFSIRVLTNRFTFLFSYLLLYNKLCQILALGVSCTDSPKLTQRHSQENRLSFSFMYRWRCLSNQINSLKIGPRPYVCVLFTASSSALGYRVVLAKSLANRLLELQAWPEKNDPWTHHSPTRDGKSVAGAWPTAGRMPLRCGPRRMLFLRPGPGQPVRLREDRHALS